MPTYTLHLYLYLRCYRCCIATHPPSLPRTISIGLYSFPFSSFQHHPSEVTPRSASRGQSRLMSFVYHSTCYQELEITNRARFSLYDVVYCPALILTVQAIRGLIMFVSCRLRPDGVFCSSTSCYKQSSAIDDLSWTSTDTQHSTNHAGMFVHQQWSNTWLNSKVALSVRGHEHQTCKHLH